MAIFRAGRRIGNMDVRIGLPRDRSLVDVEKDKRLKSTAKGGQMPGMNQATAIGNFMSQINRGEGVARANRFLIRLFPPEYKASKPNDSRSMIKAAMAAIKTSRGNNVLESSQMTRNVELMCTQVKLPHRDILTTNYVTYGPGRKLPYAYAYGATIDCMFMGDKFLRQRAFFENWQSKMYDQSSHNLEYYDSYIGSMEIYQLGQFRQTDELHPNDNTRLTYGVRLHEVYPETIGEITYQAMTDDMIPMDIPITFAYRTWENITLESLQGVGFNETPPDMPNIKARNDYGTFSTVLGNMPPEIKRAARTVIGKIRRDVPIGKATGGRVFPPYHRSRSTSG